VSININLEAHAIRVAPALFQLSDCDLKYQGHSVLNNISLSVFPGEKIAILGKSGVGKSTLLKHLRSLLPESVAWCPQANALVPSLSVYNNIYSGGLDRFNLLSNLANLVYPNKKAKLEIETLVTPLNIAELLWKSVDQLSGGQKKRVTIARALYQKRNILLADEPVSSLDGSQGIDILQALAAQHETMIVALHDVAQARLVCDRIIGLAEHSIIFDCPSTDLDDNIIEKLYKK